MGRGYFLKLFSHSFCELKLQQMFGRLSESVQDTALEEAKNPVIRSQLIEILNSKLTLTGREPKTTTEY